MSSLDEAARRDKLPESIPASSRTRRFLRRLLGANNTGEPSSSKTLSDKHGRICKAGKEPLADEIAADQCDGKISPSGHSAVALERQQRSPDLCRYCQKIVDTLPYRNLDELVVEHHGTEAGLFDSARAGCIICTQSLEDRHPGRSEFRLKDGFWKNGLHMVPIPAASGESRPPGIASLSNTTFIRERRYLLKIYTPIPDQQAPMNDAMQCHFQSRLLELHPYKGKMKKYFARRRYRSRIT